MGDKLPRLNALTTIVDLQSGKGSSYFTRFLDQFATRIEASISGVASGFVAGDGTGAAVGRTLTGTTGEIAITNAAGTAGNPVFSLVATAVTAGAFGDATHVPALTVDAKGRITASANTAITFPVSSVFGRTGVVVAAANDYSFSQISGSVGATQLPNPSSTTLGGVRSAAAVTHQWINSISTSGVPTLSQPAFADLSGTPTTLSGYGITDALSTALASTKVLVGNGSALATAVNISGDATLANTGALTVTKTGGVAFATSATTDATNASNISAGTLPVARLPIATTSALGAIKPDGTTITITAGGVISAVASGSTFPQNYLSGLTLSTAGSSSTFSVAAGQAADATNTTMMALASAISKTTSAWAVGTGNGGLDTGAIANNTWYHAFEIERSDTGVVDALVSLSASAPTMPTNYDRKRRIGSMKTDGSAQWVAFTQNGDEFLWASQVLDANAVAPPNSNAASVTLTVPTGVKVNALFALAYFFATVRDNVLLTALDQTDVAPSPTIMDFFASSSNIFVFFPYNLRTNTSGQIRLRSMQNPTGNPGGLYDIVTKGWIDTRGRFG